MDEELLRQARSFGSVADAYDRGRPSFPVEAAAWLAGSKPATVLELGAGTGKLTEQLVELGHDVHATDPDPAMLKILAKRLPDVPVSESGAEEIPLPDRSVDVVVAAQAFHWFDTDRALPEIARVLRPGGSIALAWNHRDESIPWVRRLGRILGSQDQLGAEEPVQPLVLSDLFGFVDDTSFTHWQEINRESIRDLALSRSNIATLDEEERAQKLAEVSTFYSEYGRGMDGMQLPYECRCFRATVAEKAHPAQATTTEPAVDKAAPADEPDPGPSDGTDTDTLLIDFR